MLLICLVIINNEIRFDLYYMPKSTKTIKNLEKYC